MASLRILSPESLLHQSDTNEQKLHKHLTWKNLTIMGVAILIGAGIFTVTASTAGDDAGPATSIAFIVAALACGLTAMCYAEFSSSVPVAGSVYAYSYATFGEFTAWIMGWNLILEFILAPMVISKAWSSYLSSLLGIDNLKLAIAGFNIDYGAALLIFLITLVLLGGINQSAKVATFFTFLKISVVVFIIIVGAFKIKTANYHPFLPPAEKVTSSKGAWDGSVLSYIFSSPHTQYGIYGLFTAASILFFAFIGFDVVATTAEETKNPAKDLPRGIFLSLFLVTILYVSVALVITGIAPYSVLKTKIVDGETKSATLVTAFEYANTGWIGKIVAFGGVAGLATVAMVVMLALSRIMFAMSRDGLLPKWLGETDNNNSPRRLLFLIGTVTALLSGFLPALRLEEIINMITLTSFLVVALGVIVLRIKKPNLKRGYKIPFMPLVPILAMVACSWLMINLSIITWFRFFAWIIIGSIVYFLYGIRSSNLATKTHNRKGRIS